MTPPIEIALDDTSHALTLRWPEGNALRFGYTQLRGGCPCAECRTIRIDGGIVEGPTNVTPSGMETAGDGIRLVFGDRHGRGIYPWPHLTELGR